MASAATTSANPAVVRVRSLAVGAGIALILLAIVWFFHWGSNLEPLAFGSYGTGARNLMPMRHTDDPNDTGPPLYRWSPDGTYGVVVELTNTSRVPVTLRGTADLGGPATGPALSPELRIPENSLNWEPSKPFHPITIPAHGSRAVVIRFHTNPRACPAHDGLSTVTFQSVRLAFTTLGVFHDTQELSIPPDSRFSVANPTRAECARASS